VTDTTDKETNERTNERTDSVTLKSCSLAHNGPCQAADTLLPLSSSSIIT